MSLPIKSNNMKLKVAFFISAPALGGVEKVLCTYANAMAEMCHDVSFIMCHNASLGDLISSNVKVVNFNIPRARKSIRLLRALIKKEQYDFIICSNVQTLFVLIAKLWIKCDTKIISSQHFYCNNIETPGYFRVLLRIIYNRCDKVIAVSDGIQKELTDTIHVPYKKIALLKNPINIEEIRFHSQQEVFVSEGEQVVWVGRMNPVKNLGMLLRSFARVLLEKKAQLVLVGDGDCRMDLENQCKEMGIEKQVSFVGAQTNPYKYINKASVVVLPSTSEAYPTVLLEALALGKTIVSTPTGGGKDILRNGELGYLSKDFSEEAFSDALLKGLEKPFPGNMLKMEAEKSDVKLVTEKFCSLLESI